MTQLRRTKGSVITSSGPVELSEGRMDVGDVAIALPAPPISPSALPRLRHVTADELLGDQPVATSFETLQPLLERKHAVIVRGAAGNSIRGMVSAISRDELIVVVLQLQGCDVRMDHLWQAPYRVPHHAQRQSVQMAPVRTRPHHRAYGSVHGGSSGRWCADAGRPPRFKPSSPSPTDAVRDGSAELGHPVQNVTREHGLTPLPR